MYNNLELNPINFPAHIRHPIIHLTAAAGCCVQYEIAIGKIALQLDTQTVLPPHYESPINSI